MIQEVPELFLSDHFDLYLIIFSPLIYIFGTYTLLIIQIIAVIIGAVAIRKIAIENFNTNHLLPVFHYYTFFGLYAALSFEYHSNVVAACILPWFIYFFINKKTLQATAVFLLLLISKENFSLFLVFVSLGLGFKMRRDGMLRLGILFSILSAVYFLSIVQIIMPALNSSGAYTHFTYRILGEDMPDAIKTIVTSPWHAIKYMFSNHTGIEINDYLKLETHLFLFFSGVLLLFYRPIYLFMLIPIYFQKMYHDDPLMWSPFYHYNIEFLPIIVIGSLDVLKNWKKNQNIIYLGLVISTCLISFKLTYSTLNVFDKNMLRIYQLSHYKKDYDIKELKSELDKIPNEAVISAQSPFVPYLSLRKTIYCLPLVYDSDYIIFSYNESSYPLNSSDFQRICSELLNSKSFESVYSRDSTYILKRK